MVMDTPKGPLTEFDWQILGHDYDQAKPSLPTRRLVVPIPATADGLHSLAHIFAGISEEFHRAARMGETPRYAIGDAMGVLDSNRNRLRLLKDEWEQKLRDEAGGSEKDGGKPEHLRAIG